MLAAKNMKQIVQNFASKVAEGRIEIYNEFSLQHEFGIHLRSKFPSMKVQFERHASFFFSQANLKFIKKEIDITIFSTDKSQIEAVFELKFPRNGQYPEQMFSFCKDICFVEQLKKQDLGQLISSFLLTIDSSMKDILTVSTGSFVVEKSCMGMFKSQPAKKNESLTINGRYSITWHPAGKGMKYALVET